MQTKEKVLEVRDLSVGFVSHGKKVNVIRNVTMDVYQGETLAIVGESGGGKSVTGFSVIRLIEEPGIIESGEILFEGRDVMKLS